MANKDPLLTFEQFVRRKNSFHLHFVGEPGTHFIADGYRKQEHYKRCFAKKPDFRKLVEELRESYGPDKPTLTETPAQQRKLYEAYKLMHPFAPNNQVLFT